MCQNCNKRIGVIALCPILGFLIYKGKCRYCGNKISRIYPFSEFISGIIMLIFFLYFKNILYSIILFALIMTSITIAFIDLKKYIIPNSAIIIFLLLSMYPAFISGNILNHLYGLLFMGGIFILILLLFPGGVGAGDLKYASVIGFSLGLDFSIVALETALISGAVLGISYGIVSGKGPKIKIPFGPFLTAGFITAIFFGKDIILIYYSTVM